MTPRSLTTSMDEATASFGSGLRWWRERRGLSQLDLAGAAETTAASPQLSGVRTRGSPSPDMVLRPGHRAGHAAAPAERAASRGRASRPAWRESDLSAPELGAGERRPRLHAGPAGAVPRLRGGPALESPARQFRGGAASSSFLTGPAPATTAASAEPVNLADRAGVPRRARAPSSSTGRRSPCTFLRGVQADAIADGTPADGRAPARGSSPSPASPRSRENPPPGETRAPVLIIHFKSKGETSLRLFTTIATLGTPHDVTLQEIRVECFFPMDDPTAQVFRDWARGTGGPA